MKLDTTDETNGAFVVFLQHEKQAVIYLNEKLDATDEVKLDATDEVKLDAADEVKLAAANEVLSL